MRYRIDTDKAINQLVPHYMGGRKLILYLQALMKPLQVMNDEFASYAKETRIEAAMTSQLGKFQWYLNWKFGRYIPGGSISIKNSVQSGVPIYHSGASVAQAEHMLMYKQTEQGTTVSLHYQDERTGSNSHSFVVTTPRPDRSLIEGTQYEAMLRHCIDKYRIAGKTYIIHYQ